MKSICRGGFGLGMACWFLSFWGCAASSTSSGPPAVPPAMVQASEAGKALQQEQYAGEILAYLMQVVLGKAGNLEMREAWSTRGIDSELDFDLVSKLMTDPQMDMKRILVLDNNILGLLKVLYHYNARLNLFKGDNGRQSLFPSAELLSIRVMLLQKIHREEKVNLEKLIQKRAQLMNPALDADDIDPAETGLNRSELRLLKCVIDSEPFFMDYLENPFVVDTLYRVGVLTLNDFVQEKIRQARYQVCASGARSPRGRGSSSVKIAILPSLIKAFEYEAVDRKTYPCGFKPTDEYVAASREIRAKIIDVTRQLVKAQMSGGDPSRQPNPSMDYDTLSRKFVEDHVEFLNLDQRPFVIYPGNAEAMIESICPEAEFAIIVIGENVYLSLQMSEVDIYPNINRFYLDIMDIRHTQVDYELSQVSMYIFNRLKAITDL